jgi:endoglucanase
MRKLALSVVFAFAFYATAAIAQSGGMGSSTGAQGTQGSSPNATSPNGPNGSVQPGTPAGTETPGMGQTGNSTDQNGTQSNMGDHSKGEKKLKGCIQSQGGQYVLESKHGKAVMLSGQGLASHVGHEVKVKGTWENGGSSAMSSTSSSNGGTSAASEKTFNVTNVEMVSDTCKSSSSNNNTGNASGMGAGAAGGSGTSTGAGSSSGSSTTGAGTSNSGGSSGGTGSAPPQ